MGGEAYTTDFKTTEAVGDDLGANIAGIAVHSTDLTNMLAARTAYRKGRLAALSRTNEHRAVVCVDCLDSKERVWIVAHVTIPVNWLRYWPPGPPKSIL